MLLKLQKGRSHNRPQATSTNRSKKLARTGMAFTSPAVLYFLLFWLLPVLLAIYYSFTDWQLASDYRFVGLENYIRLFRDARFLNSLGVTLLLGFSIAGIATLLSLGIALLLNDPRLKLTNAMRALFFIPVITDWVAMGLVWQFIFLPYKGVFAGLTVALGIPEFAGLRWTSSHNLALVAIIIFAVWKLSGFYIVIFSAGLRGIPTMYTEAARVDGASNIQVFWLMTFPLLMPITLFVVLTSFVTAIGLFEPIFMLTQGGPVDATRTLPLLMYEAFFSFQQGGYASAMAIITLVLTLVIALVAAGRLQYGFYED